MNCQKHLIIACLLGFVLSFSQLLPAQTINAFVSSEGKDIYLCDSPSRPCRTINAALSKVQSGATVVILDSGTYPAFQVQKAVTIAAAPGVFAGISVLQGESIIVSKPASGPSPITIVLRGLMIDGGDILGTNGVTVWAGVNLRVENCIVQRFRNGAGIRHSGRGGSLFMRDTTVQNNFIGLTVGDDSDIPFGGNGIFAVVEHCNLVNNAHEGIDAIDHSRVTIRDSVVRANGTDGLFAHNKKTSTAHAEIIVENCLITNNLATGIATFVDAGGTRLVLVSNTTIVHNKQGIAGEPEDIFSRGNNTLEQNSQGNGAFAGTFPPK